MNTQVEDSKSVSFADLEHLIEQKNDAEVTTIINAAPSLINIVDKESGRTLLHAATMHKNSAIVEYLIKRGSDIEAKTSSGLTSLMIAVNSDDPLLVKMLLDYNADMFAINLDGRTALHMGASNRSLLRRVGILKRFSEKVKIKYTNNRELFVKLRKVECQLQAIVHLCNVELTKMFLNRQDDFDERDLSCSLYDCIQCNYEENLRALLQYGTNMELKRKICLGSVQIIADRPQYAYCSISEIIGMFVRVLIDLDFLDEQGSHKVCGLFSISTKEVLCELLKTELNSYVKSKFNYEPLAYVFGNLKSGVFESIKREKLDVKMRGIRGETTLHIAFEFGAVEQFQYLLRNSLVPKDVTNYYGETAIFNVFGEGRALPCNSNFCLELFLKYNADIQICNNDGKTFIEYVEYTAEHEQTFKTILAHLAMLQGCGMTIKAPFLNFINSRENLSKFYKTVCEQVEQMKTHKIHRSLTLFDVLKQDQEVVSHRVKAMDLNTVRSLFLSGNQVLAEYDTYYAEDIGQRLGLAYVTCKTRDAAAAVLADNIDQLKGYSVVIDQICSYLYNQDLHIIMCPFPETCLNPRFKLPRLYCKKTFCLLEEEKERKSEENGFCSYVNE